MAVAYTQMCKRLEKEIKTIEKKIYWEIFYCKYSRLIRFFGDGLLLLKSVARTDGKIEMVWIASNNKEKCSPCCIKTIEEFKTLCLSFPKEYV